MWIIRDNLNPKFYFKCFNSINSYPTYTCQIENAQQFDNQEDAQMIISQLTKGGEIIECKIKRGKLYV